jgi:hypothetical protein
VTPDELLPGDVLLTRHEGWMGRLIRFGAALRELVTGKPNPNVRNHVVGVTHRDLLGVLWGIEATADGVVQVDITRRLKSAWVLSNKEQPKTPAQRAEIVRVLRAMLGTPYDWEAIVGDGVDSLGIDKFWRPRDFPDDGRLPLATVCSALLDFSYETASRRTTGPALASGAYAAAGLASPNGNTGGRFTTPADWDTFITTRAWEAP